MASLSRALLGAALVGWLALHPRPTALAEGGMVETNAPRCNGELVRRDAWLMGTTLEATVCASARESGIAAIENVFGQVRDAERRLSTWDAASEVSQLNAAPAGRWVPLSAATADVLAEVHGWVSATGGAFDPAVGTAVAAWDLRGAGREATAGELEAARRATGAYAWEVDPAGRRSRHGSGVQLDAGGFGKGAGLRGAAFALEETDLYWAILDFGGQLLFWARDASSRWPIAVADPRVRGRPALRLEVGPGSVATSGASERYVDTPAGRVGHLIDPRSARPVPAWGSVTVVADDPLAADVLSTALFVAGPERAPALAREHGVEALILESGPAGLTVRSTDGLDGARRLRAETNHATSESRDMNR